MPDQAKSKKRKLLPKFGIRFLLLVLLVVSLPLTWLAGILDERRIENNFVREANNISEASGYESFCTKWYDFELAGQSEPVHKGIADWLGAFIGHESFSRLEKLRFEGNAHLGHIDLSGLKYVKHVRIENSDIKDLNDIRCFEGLESLSILACEHLESLSGIENCQNLKSLYVSSAFPLTSLEAISGLENLESLTIQLMDPDHPLQRRTLPFKNLPKLKSLIMDYWPNKDLSPLKESTLLESLLIKNCGRLETSDGIESAQLLKNVRILNATPLTNPIALGRLKSLSNLEIDSSSLTSVAGICTAKQLSDLTLKDCNTLRSLQGIQNATGLQSLKIYSCDQLQDIRSLGELTALTDLTLTSCKSLINWQPISKLSQLKSLNLSGNRQLISLDFINPDSPLNSLSLSGTGIRNLKGLETLGTLRTLHIADCEELKTLESLPLNQGMIRFELSNCSSLKSLQGIKNLSALERVLIEDCNSLCNIRELGELEKLSELVICNCQSIEDCTPLSNSTNLTGLKLNNISNLVSVEFLDELTQIEWLDLSETAIRNCEGMENLNRMAVLKLQNCKQLVSLAGLPPSSKELQSIDIANCIALESLDGLQTVLELEDLNLKGCDALADASAIKKLFSVRVSPKSTRKKLEDKGILMPTED